MNGITANILHLAMGPATPPVAAARRAAATALPSGSLMCVGEMHCSNGSLLEPFLLVVAAPAASLHGTACLASTLWTDVAPVTLHLGNLPGPSGSIAPVVGSVDMPS